MKTLKTTFLLAFLSFFLLSACGTTEDKDTKEKKTVEKEKAAEKAFVFDMPQELEGDAEIEAYFEDLYKNLDHFADILEEMADEFEAAGIKLDDEPNIAQQLAIAQIMAPRAMAISEVSNNIAQLQLQAYGIMDTLTEERLQAFRAFDEKYHERFDELNKRFEKLSH